MRPARPGRPPPRFHAASDGSSGGRVVLVVVVIVVLAFMVVVGAVLMCKLPLEQITATGMDSPWLGSGSSGAPRETSWRNLLAPGR